ncbi:S-adenosyl-L-methionine-dependent methyltransferase [Calocera cornea HHB12733]|uniref:Cytosine-specific methyltransferase n=1 Tax=Calocera cornea HHB12733 TaxID=1353952 RepID=A0A165D0I2_9BASI|nr:S-adenosyl-L-methionine-dependent methyltransferase [Calocera cornea HHB12733]
MTSSRKRHLSDDSEIYSIAGGLRAASVLSNLSTTFSRLSVDPGSFSSRNYEHLEPAHKRPKSTNRFEVPENCILEAEDLVLEGEGVDSDESQDDDEEPSLPIRLLDSFVVFDEANHGTMMPLSGLEAPDSDLRIYGVVKPMFVGDDEYVEYDEEGTPSDNAERVEFVSTAIFLYYLESDPMKPLVWLKTQYSWLILDRPSPEYRVHYYEFWKARYVCRLALMTTSEGRSYFDLEFSELQQTEPGGAVNLRGRPFSQTRVLREISGKEETVEDLLSDAVESGWDNAYAVMPELYPRKTKTSLSRNRVKDQTYQPAESRIRSHPHQAQTKKSFRPFFTPAVERLASRLGLRGSARRIASAPVHDRSQISILDSLEDSIEEAAKGDLEGVWGLDDDRVGGPSPHPQEPYHVHDFVYIRGLNDREGNQPFRIGQIRDFRGSDRDPRVIVRLFARWDDLNGVPDEGILRPKDSCHLCATRVHHNLSTLDLRGLCVVRHHEELSEASTTRHPGEQGFYVKYICSAERLTGPLTKNNFLLLRPNDLQQCANSRCKDRRHSRNKVLKEPLKCLELFHGAGGLSLGLEQAGCIVTKWVVDASPSAHATFRANFPDAAAILQDTNEVLRRAVDLSEGKDPPPLYQIGSHTERCPELPRPGEVDIIIGGPPCQGFSRLNSFATANDKRNTLIGNALSYVDFFQPRFVLLENVRPLLHMSSTLRRNGSDEEEVVENAFAKLIVGFLVERGYQVRFKVLQAVQYGAPQERNRVIFMAALRGETLPEFPLPTHTWRSKVGPGLGVLRDEEGGAPHPYITVEDAISDLPPFHWDWDERGLRKDPDLPRPDELRVPGITRNRKRETRGYIHPVAYTGPPKTAYQRLIRGDCEEVQHHATHTFSVKYVERICNIPPPQPELGIPEGLDWRAMCMALIPADVAHPHGRIVGDTNINRDAKFARVYASRPAQTVVTTLQPGGRMTRILHYSQYRVLSARENARLQGFPDSFKFVAPKNNLTEVGCGASTLPEPCSNAQSDLSPYRKRCPNSSSVSARPAIQQGTAWGRARLRLRGAGD